MQQWEKSFERLIVLVLEEGIEPTRPLPATRF